MNGKSEEVVDATRTALRASVGAIVGLAMLITMFAALLFAYAYLRLSPGGGWPRGSAVALPKLWPLLASGVAVVGSATLLRAPSLVRPALLGTAVGVVVFQVLTLREALQVGLAPSSGPLGSVVFALTGLHAFHLSLFALIAAFCGPRSKGSSPHPAWSWTAHVLGALWIVIHVSVYVL